MKLVIFIPAYNESATIAGVIAAIPQKIIGISQIILFVVDDGSTDNTTAIARSAGAEVIQIKPNRGLANAFRTGLAAALQSGPDIIVHLDADGQYDPAEIPKIIDPILKGRADVVTGDRQVAQLDFMSWQKKYGNLLGSWFVRRLAGIKINDASCGMRAYSRAAAKKLEVRSSHTYTHETLIRARRLGLRVDQVPITFTVRRNGNSRLISGNMAVLKHIAKSVRGILGAWRSYK